MYEMNKQEIFYDNADGQGIIINSLNGCYYSLNLVSTAVFELLCAGHSPEAIAEALLALKGCPENIGQETEAFARSLLEERILIPSALAPEEEIKLPAEVFQEGFKLSFTKFDDMQDLLLSDPVHEASPEMGWPNLRDEKEQQ